MTEKNLYDEAAKKMVYDISKVIFPVIREVFGVEYPTDSRIEPLATEYIIRDSGTGQMRQIFNDITFRIQKDIYHFECQLDEDGDMEIRMLEYDFHVALDYTQERKEGEQIRYIRFPKSAVLYLQNGKNTPGKLKCVICFPDGEMKEYTVPAVKVQSYSLEEIEERQLEMFIPFLPLRFRKRLRTKTKKPTEEEVRNFFSEILLILNRAVLSEYFTENEIEDIIVLLNKVSRRVFQGHKELREVADKMTKSVIKFPREIVAEQKEEIRRLKEEKELEIKRRDEEISEKNEELVKRDEEIFRLRAELAEMKQA